MFGRLRSLFGRKSAQWQPENALEQAMVEASQNPDREPQFRLALYYGELYVPVPEIGHDQEGVLTLQPGERLAFPTLIVQGRACVPVFTSIAQLRRFVPPDVSCVKLRTQELMEQWGQVQGMLLNPNGTISTLLSPLDVRSLPEVPPAHEILPKETSYRIGVPAQEPTALLDLLRNFCERHPEILAAHRALIQVEGADREPEICIGLLLTPEADRDDVLKQVQRALAMAHDVAGGPLVILNDAEHPFSAYMLRETTPFYQRGTG